jgi:hypothetical protein
MFAAVSLALAVTLKVYPVLFGFLYFEKKQYREILISATCTIVLVLLPFLFLKRCFANILKLLENVDYGAGSTLPVSTTLPASSGLPAGSSLTVDYSKIITFFYPRNTHFIFSYTRFKVSHLIYIVLSQFKFSGNTEYNNMIVLSLSNIAQILTYFVCCLSIVFSWLIKNRWLKISLLTMAFIFFPTDSGLYCGLYVFPMIIMFFATLRERSAIFNIFTMIVFLVFLNPYQILIKNTLAGYLISYNYLFINVALITFWFVLLICSGRQIVKFFRSRKVVLT